VNRKRSHLPLVGILICNGVLTGCGLPKDPDGTTERILSSHIMRVGGTENPPWLWFESDTPRGHDASLVQRFASQMHARIVWTRGSESVLLEKLANGKLDVAIGGFTSDSPWADALGTSHAYAGEHIMFTAPGENQLLLQLDTFLAGSHREPAT